MMSIDVLNPPFALWDSNNTEISNGEVVFEGRGTTTKLFGREREAENFVYKALLLLYVGCTKR